MRVCGETQAVSALGPELVHYIPPELSRPLPVVLVRPVIAVGPAVAIYDMMPVALRSPMNAIAPMNGAVAFSVSMGV